LAALSRPPKGSLALAALSPSPSPRPKKERVPRLTKTKKKRGQNVSSTPRRRASYVVPGIRPAPPPLSATAVVSRLGHGLADDDYVGHVERRASSSRGAAMVGVVRCRAGVGWAVPGRWARQMRAARAARAAGQESPSTSRTGRGVRADAQRGEHTYQRGCESSSWCSAPGCLPAGRCAAPGWNEGTRKRGGARSHAYAPD
jgi:hypothetical protein